MSPRPNLIRLRTLVLVGTLAGASVSVGLDAVAGGPAVAATRLHKPGPPTSITFVAEGDAILASWSPPVSDGGSPITGYVESWVAGPTTRTGQCAFQTGPDTCGIGITRRGHHPVTFRVRAVNSVGQGTVASAKTYTSDQTDCAYVGPYANLESCTLAGADLAGLDLSDSQMGGADLSGADLSGADLQSAQMGGADLSGADLTGADLVSNLGGANLTGANLTGARVDALLLDADLDGANLTDADMTGSELFINGDQHLAVLTDVVWSDTVCPDGTNSDADVGTCDNDLGSGA